MGTQRNKTGLTNEVNARLTTGITDGITGAILNELEDDFIESLIFNNGTTPNMNKAILTGTYTGSSGNEANITIKPTINQTGTAGSIALFVDSIMTQGGSGDHKILDLRTDSNPRFQVYTDGYFDSKEVTEPGTPASTLGRWYVDTTDSEPKFKNDAGTVFQLAGIEKNGTTVVDDIEITGTYTGSSGTDTHIVIRPTINQTGTAGSIALYVDSIQTAAGSGDQKILDLREDSNPRFQVFTDGYFNSKEVSEPATPDTTLGRWYMDTSDSKPKVKNDSGTVFDLTEALAVTSYTVAGVPAATAGRVGYISNESGGAVLAFADGTNWRRSTDRAIIS